MPLHHHAATTDDTTLLLRFALACLIYVSTLVSLRRLLTAWSTISDRGLAIAHVTMSAAMFYTMVASPPRGVTAGMAAVFAVMTGIVGLGILKPSSMAGGSRLNCLATAGMLAAMSLMLMGPPAPDASARLAMTACLAGCAAVYGLPLLATARRRRAGRHADPPAAVLALSMVAMIALA